MIVAKTKTSTNSASSPLSIAPVKETQGKSLSFSELLHGAQNKKSDKAVQNGVLVLSLNQEKTTPSQNARNTVQTLKTSSSQAQETLETTSSKQEKDVVQTLKTSSTQTKEDTKKDIIASLLKGETPTVKEEATPLALNSEITETLTPAEIKVLIKDAKQYLKEKITTLKTFTKEEIAALPKTLKGLVKVAEKLGIDVSKITLQEVQATPKSNQSSAKLQTELQVKEPKSDFLQVKKESKKETQEKELKSDSVYVKTQSKKETLLDNVAEVEIKPTIKSSKETQVSTSKENQEAQKETKVQEQVKEVAKEIKATPLFKAQASTEITTEQLVNAKVNKTVVTDIKTQKQKADETLKLLLRGEKVTKNDLSLTADFSVATAKVIAPTATTEVTKNLESLLKGDKQESTSFSKLDGLTTQKADSFEVKLNEAKQMSKYLSQDVKTAIENYKAPFTRIKVQLNPQRLGEVDLTIVQRGKNLHINLSSNNSAINTLAMNASDLRAQLSNNGINNASLNFSNTSQSQDGSASQQQQSHQNREQAHKEYNYFESEEANEELISSLEIIVPHYA